MKETLTAPQSPALDPPQPGTQGCKKLTPKVLAKYNSINRFDFLAGVISRGGSGGGATLVKILDHFGGAQPP